MVDHKLSRLVSLDALRGLAVMGMILVNSAAGMFYGEQATVYAMLLHAQWQGLTLADTVFPAFLMMVGVSIPMALARAKADGGLDRAQAGRISARTIRLFVIGFLLSNIYWFADFASGEWRLWGVLQRIGLVYGACAALFLITGTRTRLAIIAAVLVLYWPLTLLPALDGLPNDLWLRGHNFVASVDRVLLGAGGHNYVTGPEGYDPEGLLGTLPAIAHGLIGVAIGEYLMRRTDSAARVLAIGGAAMLVAGLVWSFAFPIIKDIWSSSFVLVTCGLTTLALAALHALLDRRGSTVSDRFPVSIATAFGSNAIAAYVLHMVTGSLVGWDLLLLPYRWMLGWAPAAIASLAPVLLYMALIWAFVAWLRRNDWIIKV
jgi:predicted acyltransferase